jgi:hypothetical protein
MMPVLMAHQIVAAHARLARHTSGHDNYIAASNIFIIIGALYASHHCHQPLSFAKYLELCPAADLRRYRIEHHIAKIF